MRGPAARAEENWWSPYSPGSTPGARSRQLPAVASPAAPRHAPRASDPSAEGRHFNRVLRTKWRVEPGGEGFVVRSHELTNVQDVIPL